MLFINPIWDNEAERIGKQKCTPVGYALHMLSDLIGFVALLVLLGAAVYLVYRGIVGTFHTSLLWFLAVPFGLAVIGSLLYRLSWWAAFQRGFQYDAQSREASWVEEGQRRTTGSRTMTRPNQAMQLTASNLDVHAWSVCHPRFPLRRDRIGLAAADLVTR